jgi:hypothetical protein
MSDTCNQRLLLYYYRETPFMQYVIGFISLARLGGLAAADGPGRFPVRIGVLSRGRKRKIIFDFLLKNG